MTKGRNIMKEENSPSSMFLRWILIHYVHNIHLRPLLSSLWTYRTKKKPWHQLEHTAMISSVGSKSLWSDPGALNLLIVSIKYNSFSILEYVSVEKILKYSLAIFMTETLKMVIQKELKRLGQNREHFLPLLH